MGRGGEGGPGGAWPKVAAFGPVRPPATKIGGGGGPGSTHDVDAQQLGGWAARVVVASGRQLVDIRLPLK